MKLASVALTKAQALDIAALSNAAGRSDQPSSLRDIHVRFDENYIQFGVTDGYIVAVRRGTHGEFGGTGSGEGTFVTNAKQLAKTLRIAVRQYKHELPFELSFSYSHAQVGGHNVGVAFQPRPNTRIGDLVDDYFSHRFNIDESCMGALPNLKMETLTRLTASAGKGTYAYFRKDTLRDLRWYFTSSDKDSWRFVGAIMETKY